MESIVFVNTTTSSCRAAITGNDVARVHAKLQTELSVTVKFFATGSAPALLASPSFRVGLKATPTGAVFILTNAIAETLADGYRFHFESVDSPALLAAIGDTKVFECTFEVEWTLAEVVDRASCSATIANAFLRASDNAPPPGDPLYEVWLRNRAIRHDEEQELTLQQQTQALANLGIILGATGITLPNGKTIYYNASES